MVEAVLSGRLDKSAAPAAAKCLSAWLKLDETGAGGKLLSLADIYSQQMKSACFLLQYALLGALLGAVADDEEALSRAAADVLAEVLEVTVSAANIEADKARLPTVADLTLYWSHIRH
eukprot:scaffold155500_cov38-Prasinocladus_malaysianus.AAC.1